MIPARLDAVQRRATVAMAGWLVAMALGGLLIARTPFSADLSAFLPASPNAQQRVLIEQLQSGIAARTLLLGIEGGDAPQRAEASRRLATALRDSGLFELVQNGAGDDWQATGAWLFQHRYALSPAVSDERYTVAGLRDAIGETLSLLGTPAGNALKPTLERDPTGETQRMAEDWIPANAPRSEHGVWVSRQAPRAVLLATTQAAGADLDTQARTLAQVRAAFKPLAAQGLRLQASGAPVFSVQSRMRIEHEVQRLTILGTLVIGGLLLLMFGSLRALLVAMLPVVTGVVAGIAAVSAVFGTVHGITLAFGSTLIGEAVDYAIYYLVQAGGTGAAGGGGAGGAGGRHWRQHNWPTVRLGLLTSVCGFAALLGSGFPGLAQLGLFSIAGLIGAALTTLHLLPALAPNGASGQGLRRPLARLAERGIRLLPRLRGVCWGLGLLSIALLVSSWGQLWRGSLGALSTVSQAEQALDASLRADLGASDARTLVVASGIDVESTLRAAEAISLRLDALVQRGVLTGYDTPTRLLPSLATQAARRNSLPDASVLRERLTEATRDGPLRAARLTPFLADVAAARAAPPIRRASLADSPLGSAVDALMFPRRGGGWSALLPLQPGRDDRIAETVRAALQGLPPTMDAQVIDIKHELDALYAHYLHQALVQALLGALAVLLLLAWHLRSARRLWAVCSPLALALLLTLGGLALFGVALGILHLVGLLLVIAVGSNYGLFFDPWRGRTDADTLASLLVANLTTVTSFGLIALSDIPALSAVGQVVAPGALLALWLAAVMSSRRTTQMDTAC